MKVGLFFVCGRNFIILPQKSVPSLLNITRRLGANMLSTKKNLSFHLDSDRQKRFEGI